MDTVTTAEYVAPELRTLGSVEDLTLAMGAGLALDATFPVGTPANQLTFS